MTVTVTMTVSATRAAATTSASASEERKKMNTRRGGRSGGGGGSNRNSDSFSSLQRRIDNSERRRRRTATSFSSSSSSSSSLQKVMAETAFSSWCCFLLALHIGSAGPACATMEESGKALFRGAGGCVGCHAAGGNVVEAGKTLSLQDLTKNDVKSKEDVAAVISLGKNKMPGYGENCVGKGKCTFAKRLTDEEIDSLSAFVWNVANGEESWAKALE